MHEQIHDSPADRTSPWRSKPTEVRYSFEPAACLRLPEIPLIDREHEVREMRAALDAAVAGAGHVLLLAGEPGIGKTRLASALAGEAEARGLPVWWGRGWEDGSAPAFWPWSMAFRRWLDRAGEPAVAAAVDPFRAELGHVFPVLHDRASGLAPAPTFESDRGRFRLFEIVCRFLRQVATPAGLVIVLDDVHWADVPSLKLLEFLAAELHDTRILVVATYRDTEVRREHPFVATLSRLVRERSTRRLTISGLLPEHCAQWLAATGVDDAAALGGALHRETNGNPFFLGELVHLLAREGALATGWHPERVPHGLREVIVRRMSRLGNGCSDMLAVAALLGDTIDGRLLAEILDEPATGDHLERALLDRILVEEGAERYRFAHALIRRVACDDLTPSERASWHSRIAVVLEKHAAATEVVTSELVRHFAAAGDLHALRKAFEHACLGAEQAARGQGWEETVRLLEIALEIGGRCGGIDAKRAVELELNLAWALRAAGDIPAARARCEAVMSACRRAPHPTAFTRAALLHVGPTPQFGRVVPAERALLEEAYRGADALDDSLRARLFARLAGDIIAANETEQTERVLALCDQAAHSARRAGDAGALAIALLGVRYAAALCKRSGSSAATAGDSGLPSQREIVAAAEAGGEYEIAAGLRHLRAVGMLAAGRRDAFLAAVDGLATAAAASHAPQAVWLADALAALRATVEGRFGEAQTMMDRALATGRRTQLANASGQHVSQRIMWHFVQGRLAEVASEVESFVDGHPGGLGWQPIRALARLACGDSVSARGELLTMLAADIRAAENGVMSRCYLAGLGLLCAELEEVTHAPALYERIAHQKEAWVVDGCQTLGPWQLVLGRLALVCKRATDAARHFENAISVSRCMHAHPFVAQAQALLAEALLAADARSADRTQVAALLDEAEQSARQLGLVQVTARIERLRTAISAGRSAERSVLWRDGDFWAVSFAGRQIHLKDGKGPGYLATLLAAPGREFHVLQLAGSTSAPDATGAVPVDLEIGGLGESIEDAPDARARREYRSRVEDLRAELEEAESLCDRGRAEKLRAELESLLEQLAQCFAGRARLRGPAETARKAVTKVLRTQIGRLLDTHPPLGEHLRASVQMGTFCTYSPKTPIVWEVASASSIVRTAGRHGARSAAHPRRRVAREIRAAS